MALSQMDEVVGALKKKGIDFEGGLRDAEFAHTESLYNFSFPLDLRDFLSCGLPVSGEFPNWRTGNVRRGQKVISIAKLMDWPAEGICFDIEKNNFWMPDWDVKPSDLQEAFRLARRMVKQAPVLIPVHGHRFLPAEPAVSGNPVLSVWQTDIIFYGLDLVSYLAREFDLPIKRQGNRNKSPRHIRFWNTIIDKMESEFESERRDL
jgi:hypothetical protein